MGVTTPLKKAVLFAMAGASLRHQQKLNIPNNRKFTTTLVLAVTDGHSNEDQELVNGNLVKYESVEIRKIAQQLLATESYFLGVAYAGSGNSAEAIAKDFGFPGWRDMGKDGWRNFFGIVSNVSQRVSQVAVNGGTLTSATGGNNFLSV
jgi:hypothetical protein